MFAYLIRRVLVAVPTILVLTGVVFVLITSTGDPLVELRRRPNVSQETIHKLEREYRLDEPVAQRYVLWLNDLVHLRLGTSFKGKESVGKKIRRALWPTTQLLLGWLIFSALFAVAIGVYSALRPYSLGDTTLTGLSFFAYSAPVFFWAVLFQQYLAVWLPRATGVKLFYVAGMTTPGMEGDLVNRLQHLALPVMTLCVITIAEWSRFQRSSMLDVIGSDYVRTAKAKGLRTRTVVMRHALRNALIPLVTLIGLEAGLFLGGAIVTEKIFAWPGMGSLFIDSLEQGDFPVVMGWLVVTTVFVVVFNILTDVVYTFLDPRIRYD